jgi:hypothetical protein
MQNILTMNASVGFVIYLTYSNSIKEGIELFKTNFVFFVFKMSTLLMEKCPVCTAPLTDSQKWRRTTSTSLRSTSGKRNITGQDFK